MKAKARKIKGTRPRFSTRISREEGTVIKDWGGRLPVALVYPNSYYLGMSNLGIHTIYEQLNARNNVVCERVFWEKGDGNPPLSIESRHPLTDFAVIAFSLSYELDYFNVVPALKAGGIPIYAADRDERYPLVIAGGPCVTANPVPLSPFFDCLCIGEAEPLLPGMLPVLLDRVSDRRHELLKSLALLPGIYVPSFPLQKPIVRQWAGNLDDFATTSVVLTPDTELGDLYLIEVERGCQRGCRFCLVNSVFAPQRFRSVTRLISQARHGLKCRKRIGLVGPAVADHPGLKELLINLRKIGAEISVSSLRINSLSRDVAHLLAEGKARTITVAPEAGSERLRRLIRKGISDDDIQEAVYNIAGQPFNQLKLYFMLGLPTETDDDVEDIIKIALVIKDTIDGNLSNARITLNIATFVPKAGTPFQWLPMASLSTLNRRLSTLKKALPPKGIKVKAESPAWSHVQGVLARGDIKVADILADIEEVSLAGWRKALERCHLDTDYYVNQRWDTGQKLPWAMIDSGIGLEHLKRECEKAFA